MGDFTFSNLITSIQSDEARHAQLGTPVIEIMIRNGKKAEAQQAVDIAFWRIWRVFALLTGIPMDYWFPIEKRDRSFKEYMHEFVIVQFEQQLKDVDSTYLGIGTTSKRISRPTIIASRREFGPGGKRFGGTPPEV